MLARTLIVLACAWPIVLASAWYGRASGDAPVWSAVVYAAASRICHQQPARSFHTAGTSWPVCGRCSGLYLSAPVGALMVAAGWRSRRAARRRLALAALPTAATIVLEWAGAPITTVLRAAAALPVGLTLAAVLVDAASGARPRIK